jgi:hypothetical protein
VTRYRDEIGQLAWVSPQDWPCEPESVAKTGLTVAEHQRRTLDSVLEMRAFLPDVRVIPVLQGWTAGQYNRCAEMYHSEGIDLAVEPLVGVGTMCQRPSHLVATLILDELACSPDRGRRPCGSMPSDSRRQGSCSRWDRSPRRTRWSGPTQDATSEVRTRSPLRGELHAVRAEWA